MVNIIGFCTIIIAIYIPLIKGEKEWIFQFDLKNQNNWDNYKITPNENIEANGCSPRIPKLFKKLCVDYNENDGYKLKLKSALNMNLDPHYHDLLWYYGDHQTAKTAEQVAKAKYIDFEDQELSEITPSNTMLRRRLISSSAKLREAKKCYFYDDIKACAHMDASNKDLLTVSVGLKDDEIAAANEEDEDYYDDAYDDDDSDYDSEYYDDNDYDAEEYDLSDIYNEYMQEYNQLLNQQWANYLANWNNMYWNNYYPQMAQQLNEAAAAQQFYNDYYYYDGDSDEFQSGDSEDNGLGIQEGQIMQKAEAEARKKVEAKMEKQLESKLENQMMAQMNSGGGMFGGNSHGYVHKKHHRGGFDEDEGGEMGENEHDDDGGDMDDEHSGMPQGEMDGEDDQMQGPPHDSLSAEAEN